MPPLYAAFIDAYAAAAAAAIAARRAA